MRSRNISILQKQKPTTIAWQPDLRGGLNSVSGTANASSQISLASCVSWGLWPLHLLSLLAVLASLSEGQTPVEVTVGQRPRSNPSRSEVALASLTTVLDYQVPHPDCKGVNVPWGKW